MGVGWFAIAFLAIVSLGVVLLISQSLDRQSRDFLSPGSQGNAYIIQELADLRAELTERAREHQRIAERIGNVERIMSRVYNTSLNILSEARLTQKMQTLATPTPPPANLHSSFNLVGTERGGGTEILLITDEGYLKQFYRQAMSLRCYAWLHGYSLTLLDTNPSCVQRIFFFKKHCTVAHYLSKKPQGHVAVVMDGDTVPVDIQRRLDAWLPRHQEDLTFYEREWSPEVAAGNYIVQNSAFARRFLHEWANLESRRPPGAIFSGEDNGAIHVLLPDVLSLPCSEALEGLYRGLSHVGVNLSDLARIPLQYKQFVAAAELVRGPPRRWLGVKRWGLHGNITVLPRMHAWVADNGVTQGKGTRGFGSVFHHGVKTQEDVGRYFTGDGLQTCAPRSTVLVERQVYLRSMRDYLETIRKHYGAWTLPSGRLVPFHEVAMNCCLRELTCRPLEAGESLALGGASVFQDPLQSPSPSTGEGCFLPAVPPSEMPACVEGPSTTAVT